MIPLGAAINIQQRELARVQKETAGALVELDKVKQEVTDQRRAKNEAETEMNMLISRKKSLETQISDLLQTLEREKNNHNAQNFEHTERLRKITVEILRKEKELAKIVIKREELKKLQDELIKTKEEIDIARSDISTEYDEISFARARLNDEIKKNSEILLQIRKEKETILSEKEIIEQKSKDVAARERNAFEWESKLLSTPK